MVDDIQLVATLKALRQGLGVRPDRPNLAAILGQGLRQLPLIPSATLVHWNTGTTIHEDIVRTSITDKHLVYTAIVVARHRAAIPR